MKKRTLLSIAFGVVLVGCQNLAPASNGSAASSETNYSAVTMAAINAALQIWSQQSGSGVNALANLVQGQAGVTANQAIGGVGSLLALAANALSPKQSNELGSIIPGLDSVESSNLTSLITNQATLNTAFNALGLDSSQASTIAPILLGSLKSEGASPSLVDSLASIWK